MSETEGSDTAAAESESTPGLPPVLLQAFRDQKVRLPRTGIADRGPDPTSSSRRTWIASNSRWAGIDGSHLDGIMRSR